MTNPSCATCARRTSSRSGDRPVSPPPTTSRRWSAASRGSRAWEYAPWSDISRGHGPRPAELRRRAPDADVLAGVGPADDRHRPPAEVPRRRDARPGRLALRHVGRGRDGDGRHAAGGDRRRPSPTARRLREVEAFLAYDSELLDEWRLEEWLELFTPTAATSFRPPTCPTVTPRDDLFFIRDDYFLLSERVAALLNGTRVDRIAALDDAPDDHQRAGQDLGEGRVEAKANLLVHRARGRAARRLSGPPHAHPRRAAAAPGSRSSSARRSWRWNSSDPTAASASCSDDDPASTLSVAAPCACRTVHVPALVPHGAQS